MAKVSTIGSRSSTIIKVAKTIRPTPVVHSKTTSDGKPRPKKRG